METLDQLLSGEVPLSIIRGLYPDEASFLRGVLGLLCNGDVRLVADNDAEVPRWRLRELFIEGKAVNDLSKLSLKITEPGVCRVK